ncbi:MAG TPA: nucleoside triphosphate pyrophosphatase [Acidimicrobiales bacterium]|nr:nucleoside triphosphate pyrophosphatase [Acidimicrobiales bacterium]
MPGRRLILASASPARRWLLESAGLDPEVMVSHVPEDGVDHLAPPDAVAALARRKGDAVASRLGGDGPSDAIVVACDSLLEFGGRVWGKAAGPAEVVDRWQRFRGRSGLLHTGHHVIDAASGHRATATDTATVHFGTPSDDEIDAYAGTEESRQVAGPFTLEGRSAPWIDRIEGNYGTITGISLPLLRQLLGQLGVAIVDLWR